MRILVTGGAGYVGSVSVEALLEAGHEVTVLDDLSTGHRGAVSAGAALEVGTYCDTARVTALLERRRIDAVLHCAAKSIVGESMSDPAKYFRENVSGGIALLDAMRAAGVKRIVFSSTAATYGVPDRTPIVESDPIRPISAYGETKRCVEAAIAWYGRGYGLRSVILRYFNVAGASRRFGELHEPETHLIPVVLSAAEEGRDRHHLWRRLPDSRPHLCPRLHPRRGPGRGAPRGPRGNGPGQSPDRSYQRPLRAAHLQPGKWHGLQQPPDCCRGRTSGRPRHPGEDWPAPRRRPGRPRGERRPSRGRTRLEAAPRHDRGDHRLGLGVAPRPPGGLRRVEARSRARIRPCPSYDTPARRIHLPTRTTGGRSDSAERAASCADAIIEPGWSGVRVLARFEGGGTRLMDEEGVDCTTEFADVADAITAAALAGRADPRRLPDRRADPDRRPAHRPGRSRRRRAAR